ncbi:hypothetical protein SAMN05444167_3971 [Terriglobus roseus]|uniref:Uncharacterized protein n=2 Tax=Terriglobus roseus TaxID=392734 RepID=A0A1G7QRH7_9BACT|nr:hypothetical protein SAMN05444167_3971 [Terriglobus roseus]
MFTTEQLRRVYERMIAAGIVFDKPEPEQTPVVHESEPLPVLSIATTKEPQRPKPATFEGFDLVTGERRVYSEREINRMSADEMKRALQMTVRGEMELPRIGPGPNGRGYQA